jgi:hypothetical protein
MRESNTSSIVIGLVKLSKVDARLVFGWVTGGKSFTLEWLSSINI